MKVMISLPMKGRSDNDINIQFQNIKKRFAELHIDVVDTIFEECPEGDKYQNSGLFYLAKSIDTIAQVDAVFFAEGWQQAKGCVMERKACEYYDVKILDDDFLYPNKKPQVKRII